MSRATEIDPLKGLLVGPGEARRLVLRATPVDAVGLEERAASLATRSIKKETKLRALDLIVRYRGKKPTDGVYYCDKIRAD